MNQRRLMAMLAAVTLPLLIVAWRVGKWPDRSQPPAPATQAHDAPLHAQTPPPAQPQQAGAPPPQDPARPAQPTPNTTDTIDICGFGKLEVDPQDSLAPARVVEAMTKTTAAHWIAALEDSDDYRARAAGLFLDGKFSDDLTVKPMAEQTRDALVQLATGAGDPAVYALAMNACNMYGQGAPNGSCRQISAAAWAAMDPDNAAPWLLLAGKARAANDSAAEAAAFSHAARAHKSDAYNYPLDAIVEPSLPPDATPLQRWVLATVMFGLEAAMQSPYAPAAKHCSSDAMQDGTVRDECSALAELLVTHGTTLIDLNMGMNIGARAGWPAQRINELRQKSDALQQAIAQATPSTNADQWSCDGARLGNAYMKERVRLGELGAAREALERSGETVPELARKHETAVAELMRNAAQEIKSAPPSTDPFEATPDGQQGNTR